MCVCARAHKLGGAKHVFVQSVHCTKAWGFSINSAYQAREQCVLRGIFF